MTDTENKGAGYRELVFFSYGFRPFFLGAALFASVATPAWILMLDGVGGLTMLYPAREWHVHEMVFGFLPAVIMGFMLTAIPNWTDRPPIRGYTLMGLWMLWLAGRLVIAVPWFTPSLSAAVDGTFLVVAAGLIWREIVAANSWDHTPMAGLVSLYAVANILFHVLTLRGSEADLPPRMALAVILVLLTVIGGRIVPNFTGEFLRTHDRTEHPTPFSRYDSLSILLVAVTAFAWIVQPQGKVTGWLFVIAGCANAGRLARWHGWLTWREPLVLVLHVGYAWVVVALLMLGGSLLGVGLETSDALHALTAGAVGVMTLGVMTRASLGHTGRPRHAGPVTVLIYLLVFLGALLRVVGPVTGLSTHFVLGLAAASWSGAYAVFVLFYGPFLLQPNLDE